MALNKNFADDESRIPPEYLRHTRKFDLLESEEEFALAKEWRASSDPKALNRIIGAHLRLVAKIADGYKGYGLSMKDLVSEGHIGVMQALKRFDPHKGFRFSTYAMWWIKAHIQQFVLNSWSLVRIGTTPQQRKLFFNLRKLKKQLGAGDQMDLDPEIQKEISARLSVSEAEVADMNQRLSQPDHSLNISMSLEDGGEWQDFIVDENSDHEAQYMHQDELSKRRKMFGQALGVLNAREHNVFQRRRLKEPPDTLELVSQELGVSRERVRQIDTRAFEKIRAFIVLHVEDVPQQGVARRKTFIIVLFGF